MIRSLVIFASVLQRMNRIRALHNGQSFSQLIELAENHCTQITPRHKNDIDFLLRHRWLWKVHSGFRKQPCLYYMLLCFTYEIASHCDDIEVNVCVGVDGTVMKEAHCWLSKNGNPVYTAKGSDENNTGELLYKQGRIRYWLKLAKTLPAKK